VDFRRKATARPPEGLIFLPPFAPAAETCARTTVESNIWTRGAVSLGLARVSKKSSNTPDWLNRQNRFHTLFQFPNSAGSARVPTAYESQISGFENPVRVQKISTSLIPSTRPRAFSKRIESEVALGDSLGSCNQRVSAE